MGKRYTRTIYVRKRWRIREGSPIDIAGKILVGAGGIFSAWVLCCGIWTFCG